MKKAFYIGSFTLLGVIISFLVHALIELPALYLVANHYDLYGSSWWWQHWEALHGGGSLALLILGTVGGFWQGWYWWRVVYIENRYNKTKLSD